jgi:hypothetical protein
MMRSFKYFSHVSKTPTLTYNRENIVIFKNPIILNIMHNMFNLRDTEVSCKVLVVTIIVGHYYAFIKPKIIG